MTAVKVPRAGVPAPPDSPQNVPGEGPTPPPGPEEPLLPAEPVVAPSEGGDEDEREDEN
jgi:hypothetical protein